MISTDKFEKREFKNGVVYLGDAHDVLEELERIMFEENQRVRAARKKAKEENKKAKEENKKAEEEEREERQELIKIEDNPEYKFKHVANICVTSPPYNLCKRYSDYTSTDIGKKMTKKYEEEWYPDELSEWLYQGQQQAIIHSLLRTCDSSIWYNHRVRFGHHNRNIYRTESGLHHPMHWLHKFVIWDEIIWDRGRPGKPSRRCFQQDERIYQIGKPKKWHNENSLTNIWRINPSKNIDHPCTFPEQLVENCISLTTDPEDIVIDPYLGSGTTAVVAIKHGRKFIGIERDREYFELACKNIEAAEEQNDGQK